MRISVTVDDSQNLKDVSGRLRSAGITVEQELGALNILIAEAPENLLSQIRATAGVRDAAPERTDYFTQADSERSST